MSAKPSKPVPASSQWWKPVILIGTVIAMLIVAKWAGLEQHLGALRDWIEDLGPWGPVVFIVLYAAATVAALPGSALTIAAGALFGSLLGVIVVSIAATLGASLSFLIARYFARDAVAAWLTKNEKFARLDELTARHGAIIVALTRLVPIFPFNLLNYGFGLTRVPFSTYVFWSWLCMLPGTVLYVVGADVVTRAITQGRVSPAVLATLAAAAVAVTLLVRYARQRLQMEENHTDIAETDPRPTPVKE